MARITEALFQRRVLTNESPAAETIKSGLIGNPQARKTTPVTPRVSGAELELAYMNDPIIFNGINKIVQTIMAAHYEIKAKDPKVKKFFEDFVEGLGNSGSAITWDELLTIIFRYQCIFGWAWIENVYNVKGNMIVDWDFVDPKKMDYAKNASQKIVMDKYGRPGGYVQNIPMGESEEITNVGVPEEVSLQFNQKYIKPTRIALVKLYTVGDGFYPAGLIEPSYKSVLRKLNINEAVASSYWRHGFPTVWAQLGDENHEPTPNQIQSLLLKLKDLNNKKEIVTPYYYKLNMLESKQSVSLAEHLTIFRDDEITGLGVPKPYVTGSGEATNRSTLGYMSDLFQLTLKDIINNTCQSIRKNMFRPLAILNGFKEVPTLEWDVVGIGELDAKAARIIEYVKAGLLEPTEELKEFIKRLEKL